MDIYKAWEQHSIAEWVYSDIGEVNDWWGWKRTTGE